MTIRGRLVKKGPKALKTITEIAPFHGKNRGSNPRGDANKIIHKLDRYPLIPRGYSVPSVTHHSPKPTRKNTLIHESTREGFVNSKKRGAR